MTTDSSQQHFGRVVVSNEGIHQRPILWFFGRPFNLAWPKVNAWAVTDQVIHDVKTGTERIDRRVLELHSGGNIYYVIRSDRDSAFQQIVAAVRRKN